MTVSPERSMSYSGFPDPDRRAWFQERQWCDSKTVNGANSALRLPRKASIQTTFLCSWLPPIENCDINLFQIDGYQEHIMSPSRTLANSAAAVRASTDFQGALYDKFTCRVR